jgi:hypothetical protein
VPAGRTTVHPVYDRSTNEHYYAAYAHDPDGNNVEAVCHSPE